MDKKNVGHEIENGLHHLVHALIAGLKAHPEALAELAGMIASQKVDTKELVKIGTEVAAAGAAAEIEASAKPSK